MKKLICSIAIVLTMTFSLNAQEDRPAITKMGGGGFTIGYGNFDVSKLQSFVSENVPEFRNDHLLLGLTGHTFINNFVIGGSGYALVGDAIKTSSQKIQLAGGQGTFDFGYLILNKEKVKAYPLLGVGGGGYGLRISQNQDVSVADIASNPGREINVNRAGFVIDASINIDFIPALIYDAKEDALGGFMTGLRLGYIHGFANSNWSYTGGDVTNGPNFGISMFYAKLVIGGFGMAKK
jgi:hypothetical protein